MIDDQITIEELVRVYPFTVTYLMQKGIKCIACGEPIWGTLRETVYAKGYDKAFLDACISEINEKIQSIHLNNG